jgi:hypothetical protein
MRKSENEGSGIAAFIDRHLFSILIGLAWVFSDFNSNEAVTVEKFRAIDQSLNDLKSELRTMRERATCPDLGQYSRSKGK